MGRNNFKTFILHKMFYEDFLVFFFAKYFTEKEKKNEKKRKS